MTAKLYALPTGALQNIPEALRRVADQIEAGEFGEAKAAVVVLESDDLDVFGIGTADASMSHYLLSCAQRRLQDLSGWFTE